MRIAHFTTLAVGGSLVTICGIAVSPKGANVGIDDGAQVCVDCKEKVDVAWFTVPV